MFQHNTFQFMLSEIVAIEAKRVGETSSLELAKESIHEDFQGDQI